MKNSQQDKCCLSALARLRQICDVRADKKRVSVYGAPTMAVKKCPTCQVIVLPMADGSCPGCGGTLANLSPLPINTAPVPKAGHSDNGCAHQDGLSQDTRCPQCGLINPLGSINCDCGYSWVCEHVPTFPPDSSSGTNKSTGRLHLKSNAPCCICGKEHPNTVLRQKRVINIVKTGAYDIGIESGEYYDITYEILALPACTTCAILRRVCSFIGSGYSFALMVSVVGITFIIHWIKHDLTVASIVTAGGIIVGYVALFAGITYPWEMFYDRRTTKYIKKYSENESREQSD